jgi:hypothetical protein
MKCLSRNITKLAALHWFWRCRGDNPWWNGSYNNGWSQHNSRRENRKRRCATCQFGGVKNKRRPDNKGYGKNCTEEWSA